MAKEFIDLTVDSPQSNSASQTPKNQTMKSASSSSSSSSLTAMERNLQFKRKAASSDVVPDHPQNPPPAAMVQAPNQPNSGFVPSTGNTTSFKDDWNPDEHELFLMGLIKHGKGRWRDIAREFVRSKTVEEVKEYAESFFENFHGTYFYMIKKKKITHNEQMGNSSSSNSEVVLSNGVTDQPPLPTSAVSEKTSDEVDHEPQTLASNVQLFQQPPTAALHNMVNSASMVVEAVTVAATRVPEPVVHRELPQPTLMLFPKEAPAATITAVDHEGNNIDLNLLPADWNGGDHVDLDLRLA
ncbi:putative Transcription factor [Quillaja saponaria]|uniref:Transcription factor n=1 Tax=Quillaja saponaria TaxID=32244 RepID=A0AAD7PFK8_QUISA|nr:putative Transcription factor [Quillaja saponaria]